jgi:hypothetical protein
MTETMVALYDDLETAESVVKDLMTAGFSGDNISMIASDPTGRYATRLQPGDTEPTVIDEDVTGEEGASFGMIVGALVGVGTMLIPGIGPVIAAGPVAALLIGAGVGATAGAVTGGVVASLVKFGVDEDSAGYYAEGVRRGSTLVIVHTDAEARSQALEIMQRHHPVDVSSRAAAWRDSGWAGFDNNAGPYTTEHDLQDRYSRQSESVPAEQNTPESTLFSQYEDSFRTHYNTAYATAGHPYEYYMPAYQYGYFLARNQAYTDHDWDRLEMSARRAWEEQHPETVWDDVKDAVRNAWENVKDAVR